ncbi:hypothetical protein TNCV_4803931 [Trichonephila clavipes]|nr:hypothetical protein TNCV_4803931 [Trichonephila clavipes]
MCPEPINVSPFLEKALCGRLSTTLINPLAAAALSTDISKTVPKALEFNEMTLAVFAKDLLIVEKNSLLSTYAFPSIRSPMWHWGANRLTFDRS